MKKKGLLIALALSLGLSVASMVACSKDDNGGDNTPPVDLVEPDQGMKIDGVFDEDVWSQQKWLKTSVVDAEDFQNDHDRAKTLIGNAAKVNSTVRFGEKGMYVAFDVTNASGDGVFVNADRDESYNSGVELYIAQADGQVSKVKLSPSGDLYWQTRDGSSWKDYEGEVSAYLGTVAKDAAVNEDGCGGYSIELFVPAEFMTSVGFDLSALRDGTEDLLLNAVLVSSYSYDATSADRWTMGSQLDNGSSLTSSAGWYVFDGNGADIYSLSFTKTGNGEVMDMFGRDYAVANNSVTLYLKADADYMIGSCKVGTQAYTPEYSNNDFSAGTVVIPATAVQGNLAVTVDFKAVEKQDVSVEVSATRFGDAVDLEGAEVVFYNSSDNFTLDISGGKATGQLLPGVYTAELVKEGQTYDPIEDITFMGEGIDPLEFVYDAFKAQQNCVIDDSHANDEDGYVSHVSGADFYALMNEKIADSVFTVTFRSNQSFENNSHIIMYVFDDGKAFIPSVKYENGTTNFRVEWMGYDVYGVKPLHGWDKGKTMPEFNDAYTSGEGVDLTVVRSGLDFFVFVSEHGNPETMVYFDKFTASAEYEDEIGRWAIADWSIATGATFPFSLDESEETIENLTQFSVTISPTTGGKVEADKTSAKIGETITVTITPDDGKTVDTVKVNNAERSLSGGKLTLTYDDGKNITVEVTFKDANPVSISAGVTAVRLGEQVSLDGLQVKLSGAAEYTIALTGNQLSKEVLPGTYTATLVDADGNDLYYEALTLVVDEEGNVDVNGEADLDFAYIGFTANLIFGQNNEGTPSGPIDTSHVNDEIGYITNLTEGRMWAVTNETFGNSTLTVTVQKSDIKENILIAFIIDQKVVVMQAKTSDKGNFYLEWRDWMDGFGVSTIISPTGWPAGTECPSLNEAFAGEGVDVTMVRDGNQFYVFASEHGKPETAILGLQCTISEDYAATEGNWVIGSHNANANAQFEFVLGEDDAAVKAWTTFSVTLPESTEGGKVEADKTSAKIGETITVTITPDIGKAIDKVSVNGETRIPSNGQITITFDDGFTNTVEVTFKNADPVSFTAGVTAVRLGEQIAVDGLRVKLSGDLVYTLAVDGNQISGQIVPGTYTATLVDADGNDLYYGALTVVIDAEGKVDVNGEADLDFAYIGFTANLILGNNSGAIDTSHVNDENGYITNLEEGRMWAVMNEPSGDSALTATLQKSDINENMLIAFIIDQKVVVLQAKASNDGNFRVEWRDWMADFGVGTIISPTNWSGRDCPEFNDAFNGDGVDVTVAREGNKFYVFASEHGKPETAILCMTCTISEEYSATEGNWVIGSHNAKANAQFGFVFEDGTDAVNAWTEYSVTISTVEGGTVTPTKTTAKVDETITITLTPAEGKAIDTVKVNGAVRAVADSKFTVSFEDGRQISLEITFKDANLVNVNAGVTAMRLGEQISFEGVQVEFAGIQNFTLAITGNSVTGQILPGTYTAKLIGDGTDYFETLTVVVGEDGVLNVNGEADLDFFYDAFTANLIYGGDSGAIDITHANDVGGYISKPEEGDMWAVSTEGFGDSAFTVTVTKSALKGELYLANILDNGKVVILQVKKSEARVEWRYWAGHGIADGDILNPNDWSGRTCSELNDVYTNDGINVTMVREGNKFYVFMSDPNDASKAYLCMQLTVSEEYATIPGHWTIGNGVTAGAQFPFVIEEGADAVAAWTQFSVTLPESTEGGKVEADKTTAKIGETITVTITPDEGKAIDTVKVNGTECEVVDNKISITYADVYTYAVEVTFTDAVSQI